MRFSVYRKKKRKKDGIFRWIGVNMNNACGYLFSPKNKRWLYAIFTFYYINGNQSVIGLWDKGRLSYT